MLLKRSHVTSMQSSFFFGIAIGCGGALSESALRARNLMTTKSESGSMLLPVIRAWVFYALAVIDYGTTRATICLDCES